MKLLFILFLFFIVEVCLGYIYYYQDFGDDNNGRRDMYLSSLKVPAKKNQAVRTRKRKSGKKSAKKPSKRRSRRRKAKVVKIKYGPKSTEAPETTTEYNVYAEGNTYSNEPDLGSLTPKDKTEQKPNKSDQNEELAQDGTATTGFNMYNEGNTYSNDPDFGPLAPKDKKDITTTTPVPGLFKFGLIRDILKKGTDVLLSPGLGPLG